MSQWWDAHELEFAVWGIILVAAGLLYGVVAVAEWLIRRRK